MSLTPERKEIRNGNELIIEGGLEAGFSLYTGYPGSPLADYFNILYQRKDELAQKGIKVVIANSEANAAAMASGAKQAGRDCLVAMKSMGLHVASDALSVGNFADPGRGGVVIVVGDDPWSMSTSTPADSRYLFKHLHIPFLEPSTAQELKDWMKIALEISRETSVYQGIVLTTAMAEGGGRVTLYPHKPVKQERETLDPATFNLQKNVMVPPNSLIADQVMINERFPRVLKAYAKYDLDRQYGLSSSEIGFLSSGVIFETLKQVLEEHDLLAVSSLYKLASSYPLGEERLLAYLRALKVLVVVEEKRGFLEGQVRELCQRFDLDIQIFGKKFGEDEGFAAHGGLDYERIASKISELAPKISLLFQSRASAAPPELKATLPMRLPTFCPGCPHRETLSLLKDLRKTLKEEGVDLISHGDVGCYSLSFLPPFKEMHNLSAMGQGGALGAGLDLFSNNPSVVLMGDSTFFHSGLTDISNSVQCGHDITYILLDNDNTAMTGHQMTPRSGESVDGHLRPRQNILQVAKSLGVSEALEVNPSDRYFYRSLLRDYIKKPGVKVIVSQKECALTFHGRKKALERKTLKDEGVLATQRFYQINTDSCEDCRVCVEATGCPGLTQVFDAYGSKVAIDPQICVADSYCTKMKACPSFEQIDVMGFKPVKIDLSPTLEPLKNPVLKKTYDDIAAGSDFRVVVTGVGGSGVTTLSRVLAEAAKTMGERQDLDFKFLDQKGLAQRNGNVTAHLAIYPQEKSHASVTPLATADLILSPDLLDASKHRAFLGADGLFVVDSDFQVPVSIILDDGVDNEPMTATKLGHEMEQAYNERLVMRPFKKLSELALGKAVYASAMILGASFQLGRLPFNENEMRAAFERAMKKGELDNNWMAFHLGRELIARDPKDVLARFEKTQHPQRQLELCILSLQESLLPWQHQAPVVDAFQRELQLLTQQLPMIEANHLARYLHDLYIYDRGTKSESFIREAIELKRLYPEKEHLIIALRLLAKSYFVKDEVFVSHIMISPLQRERDLKAYKNLGASFHKTRMNRPEFIVFGKMISFDINPRDWMLKIMRHARWLRFFLPGWHKKEREIALKQRSLLLTRIPHLPLEKQRSALKRLENIKGYRQVRYDKAIEAFQVLES
jgi:indolepyruvate ferredoxin oxidoreductase